ncbi:MAG: hypothetical protein ACK5AC_11370 [Planctomycetota bacterium]|jgi:hypothetical protein
MATENARVQVRVCGEDNLFWVANTVNGYDCSLPIHTASIEDAEKIAPEVERLIKTVYRKAYRDGYSSCQRAIKEALGIPLHR